MKRTIRSEEQIIGILQEHEAGAKCADLCRKHGMSEDTFYAWKAKYSGMTVSEAKRLKALEDENAKLKRLLANERRRFGYRRLFVLLSARASLRASTAFIASTVRKG